MAVQSVPKSPSLKKKKAKEKVTAKVGAKELVKHTLVKKKHKTLNGGQKKMVFSGPKVKEARKVLRKVKNYLSESDFRTYQPENGTGNECHPYKGRGKDQKKKGKEGACPQAGLFASETHSEEGFSHSWDDSSTSATRGTTAWFGTTHPAWMPSVPLNLANHPTHFVLDLGCTRSIGSRAAIKKVPETRFVLWHYDRVLPLQ